MAWTAPRTWVSSEVVSAATMNAHVRDNLNALNGFVRKTADESVTSSTTLQNDNHLTIAIPAAGSYEIKVNLLLTSAANAAGDFRYGATFPAGTMYAFSDGMGQALPSGGESDVYRVSGAITSGVDPAFGFGTSTTVTASFVTFLFIATASGTFQFQWAQAGSNANATTVKAGSYLTMKQAA